MRPGHFHTFVTDNAQLLRVWVRISSPFNAWYALESLFRLVGITGLAETNRES